MGEAIVGENVDQESGGASQGRNKGRNAENTFEWLKEISASERIELQKIGEKFFGQMRRWGLNVSRISIFNECQWSWEKEKSTREFILKNNPQGKESWTRHLWMVVWRNLVDEFFRNQNLHIFRIPRGRSGERDRSRIKMLGQAEEQLLKMGEEPTSRNLSDILDWPIEVVDEVRQFRAMRYWKSIEPCDKFDDEDSGVKCVVVPDPKKDFVSELSDHLLVDVNLPTLTKQQRKTLKKALDDNPKKIFSIVPERFFVPPEGVVCNPDEYAEISKHAENFQDCFDNALDDCGRILFFGKELGMPDRILGKVWGYSHQWAKTRYTQAENAMLACLETKYPSVR